MRAVIDGFALYGAGNALFWGLVVYLGLRGKRRNRRARITVRAGRDQ